ncbi:MAG: TRL-like family protein [Chitinispirillaceae bacterium]|nr:TRL-like family protein [Chitinispirillaceae bacterium]
MFKKIVALVLCVSLTALLTGCGSAMAISPVTGFLYTDVKAPVAATSAETSSKVGTATCSSILGFIAVGDASIETAAKNAGITKIHHVDYKSFSVLGIYASYTVYVYGE